MNILAPIKSLSNIRPFSWLKVGVKAIMKVEMERLKPGSNEYVQYVRTRLWFKNDGDKIHRLNYPLNIHSLVFDLGGFQGDFASATINKYNCSVFIFEPVPSFFDCISERFSNNNKVRVFCFGLAESNYTQKISSDGHASSMFINAKQSITVQLKSIIDFMREENILTVDLIKINIEGAEYDLMECLIKTDLIRSFKNIQIQFHDFIIPDAKNRMLSIQNELAKTHFLTYSYEFVWENWQLKN